MREDYEDGRETGNFHFNMSGKPNETVSESGGRLEPSQLLFHRKTMKIKKRKDMII